MNNRSGGTNMMGMMQNITHEISYIMNIWILVIMGENNSVPLFFPVLLSVKIYPACFLCCLLNYNLNLYDDAEFNLRYG